MTTIEQQLIEVSQEIGAIAECNGSFTHGLSLRIKATDKQIGDLTVCELLKAFYDYRAIYNRHHAE
jgi:hypothetical protein